MGCIKEFICTDCGYSVESSGGRDYGMQCATTTILCEDCKKLYDVTISKQPWDTESFHEPLCPKVKSHRIRLWNYPDVCPKCGGEMKLGMNTTYWD